MLVFRDADMAARLARLRERGVELRGHAARLCRPRRRCCRGPTARRCCCCRRKSKRTHASARRGAPGDGDREYVQHERRVTISQAMSLRARARAPQRTGPAAMYAMSASSFAVSHGSRNGYCRIMSARPMPARSKRLSATCGVTRSQPRAGSRPRMLRQARSENNSGLRDGEQHVSAEQRHVTFEHNCVSKCPRAPQNNP